MQIWAKNHIFGHGCAVHGPWFMVQDSSVTFIPHSSFFAFLPIFHLCGKNAKNVWCILETFLPFCRLHAETATLWWLCSVAFPKSTPINISKKVKNEGSFAFCRKTQDGKPQQKLTSLKALACSSLEERTRA